MPYSPVVAKARGSSAQAPPVHSKTTDRVNKAINQFRKQEKRTPRRLSRSEQEAFRSRSVSLPILPKSRSNKIDFNDSSKRIGNYRLGSNFKK